MKKDHKLNDKFNPKDFEDKIYENWEEKNYFKPSDDKTKESYCIMMPPPNVTGKLHMGHALDDTIQDVLIRYKRMRGYRTLWLPGSDHAAISTEMKVVQKLAKEGKTKKDLGREKFLEEAWNWTKEYGGIIQNQQKKLGCSCDWTRNRFTLDEGMSDAVLEQFIRLYEKGLIYKGKRMVNWCTSCNTSISDAEVEYKEEASHLWHIRYKITGTENDYIEVATTRPETMLGDTAVAVHPSDKRYKNLIGKTCILPIMNKEIPIIADEFVEMEFGTGCVKITPAHDMNDYQAGLRHNLEIIEVFDDKFKMGNLVPEYEGMDLLEAREKIVEKLKEIGALVRTEDYTHNVAKCERCKSTIEPKISEQWFVSMKDLAKRAADSVRNGETRFVPQRYEKQYFHWLDNIQDWCISRQLWWGHRIPVYYCDECGHFHVSKKAPEKCEKCGSTKLHQDPDTLDTWFSSALWPFSTLGWPNTESEDYKEFYPTQTLVTGFDIITFWISRMMTQGLEFTNEVPFKDVLVHGIVRDSQGRKMSKTLGNGIDPLDIIDKYGADSLRFSVLSGTTMGNDIRFMPEKLEQASNFANKIWNAAKFITNSLADDDKVREFCFEVFEKNHEYNSNLLKIEDKWILNKFDKLVADVSKNLDNYDLGIALDKIYSFIWNEFCDWYIEMVKPRIYSEDENEKIAVSDILNHVFGSSLKLLHPFMPFITSEIYSKLICFGTEDLIVAKWPDIREKFVFDKEEEIVEKLKRLIVEIRNIRTQMNVHPSKKSKLLIVKNGLEKDILSAKEFLIKLGFASEIEIIEDETCVPQNAVSIVVDDIKAYLPFEELVDLEEERKRLEGEKTRLEAEVLRGEKMLSNPGFVNKAPEKKVNEEKEKLANYKKMLENVNERLKTL
ncbi:MAG TPA: valine--tRNA ligase [Candidatus Scatovivens faecipullorum]|nr:valine--tRNA ligase [Candidatus Scatovivens faecipullorum]